MDRQVRYYKSAASQRGATFVEAALTLPILLTVTFVSIFFFLTAARNASLQMLANDIAKDISLALQANGVSPLRECQGVAKDDRPFFDLSDYATDRSKGCWKTAAKSQFLLQGDLVTINVVPTLVFQWYDVAAQSSLTQLDALKPGDLFQVQLSYPAIAIMGQRIPRFGDVTGNLYASAIGSVEKPPQ